MSNINDVLEFLISKEVVQKVEYGHFGTVKICRVSYFTFRVLVDGQAERSFCVVISEEIQTGEPTKKKGTVADTTTTAQQAALVRHRAAIEEEMNLEPVDSLVDLNIDGLDKLNKMFETFKNMVVHLDDFYEIVQDFRLDEELFTIADKMDNLTNSIIKKAMTGGYSEPEPELPTEAYNERYGNTWGSW